MYRILIVTMIAVLFCVQFILADGMNLTVEHEAQDVEHALEHSTNVAEAQLNKKDTSANLPGPMDSEYMDSEEVDRRHQVSYQLRGGRAARLTRSVYLGHNGRGQQLHAGAAHDWNQNNNWGAGGVGWSRRSGYADEAGLGYNGMPAEQTGSE